MNTSMDQSILRFAKNLNNTWRIVIRAKSWWTIFARRSPSFVMGRVSNCRANSGPASTLNCGNTGRKVAPDRLKCSSRNRNTDLGNNVHKSRRIMGDWAIIAFDSRSHPQRFFSGSVCADQSPVTCGGRALHTFGVHRDRRCC